MNKPNRLSVFFVLVAVWAVLGGIALLKGGLFIGKHEGDTLHFMDIVMRMAQGQMPHRDFMTPIGFLAFAPVALFVKAGQGLGMAVLSAQVLVALIVLPAAWWVGVSRLSSRIAMAFGGVVLVLVLALVHGEADSAVSISMHYNRWAWAAAYLAITTALLKPVYRSCPLADGAVIGIAMAVMALIKVTYFASFAVPVVVALLLTKQSRALVISLVFGLLVAGVVTAVYGTDFWFSYLNDLREVAGSANRAAPGLSFKAVMTAPAYLGITMTAVAAVILLRKAGVDTGGLVLLLLLPGFVFVTYQNFGNDPQWVLLMAILIYSMKAGATSNNESGKALGYVVAIAVAFGAPSFLNLAYSPFRHYSLDTTDYLPILLNDDIGGDIYAFAPRIVQVDEKVARDGEGEPFASWRELADRDEPTEFRGMVFDECTQDMGMSAYFRTIADDLDNAGYGGVRLFAADIFNPYWLFGDFKPLIDGAPWYYDGLPGYEDATHVLVPLCPMSTTVHGQILEKLTERGTDDLTEVQRTPVYILYEKG